MKKVYMLLALIGAIGFLVCLAMFITAIRFGELGRVIVYFVAGLLCLELTFLMVSKYKK